MDGGPPCFGPGFTCPALLGKSGTPRVRVRLRGCHPVPPAVPGRSAPLRGRARGAEAPAPAPPQPRGRLVLRPWRRSPVWPWPPFARRYSGDLAVDFSSSGYLDVSVPRVVLPPPMGSAGGCRRSRRRVLPFGNPRIQGRVRLPGDYRGLPRPSSASCAKASAVRP